MKWWERFRSALQIMFLNRGDTKAQGIARSLLFALGLYNRSDDKYIEQAKAEAIEMLRNETRKGRADAEIREIQVAKEKAQVAVIQAQADKIQAETQILLAKSQNEIDNERISKLVSAFTELATLLEELKAGGGSLSITEKKVSIIEIHFLKLGQELGSLLEKAPRGDLLSTVRNVLSQGKESALPLPKLKKP